MRRVLFTGSREWTDEAAVRAVVDFLPADAVVIHGACETGLDAIVDRLARARGLVVDPYPANWRVGKFAGSMRNQRMIDQGQPTDAHAFPLGGPGTSDCMSRLREAGVPMVVH